jgi:hypothetical protein
VSMIAVSRSAGCVPGSSAQTIASLQRRCRQLRGGLTAGNSSWGAAFNDPDYVKIVWTLRADPVDATHSVFRTETRQSPRILKHAETSASIGRSSRQESS